jgi:hypothetical protein
MRCVFHELLLGDWDRWTAAWQVLVKRHGHIYWCGDFIIDEVLPEVRYRCNHA